jgi:hypothetical protein
MGLSMIISFAAMNRAHHLRAKQFLDSIKIVKLLNQQLDIDTAPIS